MTGSPAAVGASVPRRGLAAKLRGAAEYTADLHRPRMLYGRVLRSPHAHARVVRVDAARALALPGVHAVITHADAPEAAIDADLRVLDPVVRFVGDEVAVVGADTEAIAEDALALIEVDYAVLPAVFDAGAALQPRAPQLHDHAPGNLVGGASLLVERGDARAAMARADKVYEGRFHTPMHGPVGMETRSALAEWQDDQLTVWKTSRSVHQADQRNLARVFGLPLEQVRVVCTTMGGGFGNKDEGRIAFLAALLARKTGRPVRIEYGRAEEFIAGRNRQETEMRLAIGTAADGAPIAIDLEATMNAGAYVASGVNVTRRIGQGPIYLYTCPDVRFEGWTAYTNRPPGGSYRGLGAPLGHFALEVLVDQVASDRGEDPLDYRLKHHVRLGGQPGTRTTPPGEIVPDQPVEGGVPFSSNGLRDCLLAGAERIGWRERRRPNGSTAGERRGGLGMAMAIYKGGVGPTGEAEVRLTPEGRAVVAVGVVDVGQGSETLLAQIAAQALGLPEDRVEMVMADTATTPPGHTTAGSSTTITSGSAVKLAAEDARRQAVERARQRETSAEPSRSELGELLAGLGEEVVGRASVSAGSPDAIINSFAAHFCEVQVDCRTGRIAIVRYVAAHDSGTVINPRLAENQVSGGVLQFLGAALREEILIDKRSGVTLNPSFLEHKSTSIVDFPAIEVLFPAGPDPLGPFGAKALGEPPVVPVFAAVANAVANATGVWLETVPFTPQRVLAALHDAGVP